MVTPELLCPDRRDRVLDLYYSTAVSPREYLAAKFAAAMGPLLLTTLAPVLFLFAGNILFAVAPARLPPGPRGPTCPASSRPGS